MNESQALLRVQEIDLELMRLNARLKAMPQQKRLAAIEAARRNLAGKLTAFIGQRKDVEMELDENETAHIKTLDRIAEVQAESYQRSSDYRGIRDLEAHLTALAKQQEKLEFKHGQLAEKLDKLQRAEQSAHELDERLEEERKQTVESFERDTADLRAQMRVLATERATVRKDISDEVYGRYEKALKRFGGLAVERLRGNMPSTCRVKLQQGIFSELMRGPVVAECPYCHRLLVTEGALADE